MRGKTSSAISQPAKIARQTTAQNSWRMPSWPIATNSALTDGSNAGAWTSTAAIADAPARMKPPIAETDGGVQITTRGRGGGGQVLRRRGLSISLSAGGRRLTTAALAVTAVDRRTAMGKNSFAKMKFSKVYPLYVRKAERKNRTRAEVDQVICWLTGYDAGGLRRQLEADVDFETFFARAPGITPKAALITGVVCGVRVEAIEDPLMRNVRYLDKLVDELAKGKAMGKVLRE